MRVREVIRLREEAPGGGSGRRPCASAAQPFQDPAAAREDQRLTWTLLGEASDNDDERLDQLRYRLNVLINADLRYSFGQ